MAGTTHDLTLGFSYNPAGEIVSRTSSNDVYAFTGHTSGTVAETPNGLNQLAVRNGAAVPHDAKGNVARDPTTAGLDPQSSAPYSYGYGPENHLTTVYGPYWTGTLNYDGLDRLHSAGAGGRTYFGYDGENRVSEHVEGDTTLRVLHGPGVDEPLVTWDGDGRRFLHADERGSIIAISNASGAVANVNTYDEYGNGPSTNRGRFQFTGKPTRR
jgi:hypothetical protein